MGRQSGQPAAQRDAYLQHLNLIPFPVTASLDSTIASSDVLSLRVGDTLSLGAPASKDVQFSVAGMPKFTGRLFAEDSRLRLRLTAPTGVPSTALAPRAVAAGPGDPLNLTPTE